MPTTKQPKSKLNVKLLRKIQKHILEEPRRFFMLGVVMHEDVMQGRWEDQYAPDLSIEPPPCGTAACIAGWTALLSGKTPRQTAMLTLEWSARKLGLAPVNEGHDQASPVFYAHKWPRPFSRLYENAKTPVKRAEIAAARIDHLIATGE